MPCGCVVKSPLIWHRMSRNVVVSTQEPSVYHPFSKGRPKGHVFQTVSTRSVSPAERYHYWFTDVIRTFELATPDEWQRRDFRASVTSLATMAGEMHYAVSDAYAVHLTKEAIRSAPFDELALFLMLKGRVRYAYEGSQETEVTAGGSSSSMARVRCP